MFFLSQNHFVDPQLLPVPQRVSLTHLYCTAIKDGMMVPSMTHRYKAKHVTTVFYSVTPQSSMQFS
jgi:5'-AMP-activated protein kinase regulatory beta subunit